MWSCLILNHICIDVCDDDRQLFYTRCSYAYQSGVQCSNPVPLYIVPPFCGGHCDNISVAPPVKEEQSSVEDTNIETDQQTHSPDGSHNNSQNNSTSCSLKEQGETASVGVGVTGVSVTDVIDVKEDVHVHR